MKLIFAALFLAVAGIGSITWTGSSLRTKHGRDIRIIWYFFSLAAVVTYFIAMWGMSKGALTAQGRFVGDIGDAISQLMQIIFDLETDVIVMSTLIGVVILPQFLMYILSGIFGNATKPYLLDSSLRFFLWSLVKSFAVASGTAFACALYAHDCFLF